MRRGALAALVLLACRGPTPATAPADSGAPAFAEPAFDAGPARPLRDPEAVAAELRGFVERRIGEGYEPEPLIVARALDAYGDEYAGEGLEERLLEMVRSALEVRRGLEAGWRSPTDCDRLDRAFTALECQGIVARQDWQEGARAGLEAMADELRAERARGREIRGFVFFDSRAVEELAARGQGRLPLTFDAAEPGVGPRVAVGDAVAAALRAQGLEVDWSRHPHARISGEVRWQKRRFPLADPRGASAPPGRRRPRPR